MKKISTRKIKDRIKRFDRVSGRSLIVNPQNIRRHGKEQREAMKEVLERIGIVAPYIVRETPNGLLLLDGELRTSQTLDMDVPVIVLNDDVTDEDAALIIATFNAVGELADSDAEALRKLIDSLQTDDAIVGDLLSRIHGDYEPKNVELKSLDPPAPPKMSWVLIGIPTVKFGDIQKIVDSIASISDVIVETTVTD